MDPQCAPWVKRSAFRYESAFRHWFAGRACRRRGLPSAVMRDGAAAPWILPGRGAGAWPRAADRSLPAPTALGKRRRRVKRTIAIARQGGCGENPHALGSSQEHNPTPNAKQRGRVYMGLVFRRQQVHRPVARAAGQASTLSGFAAMAQPII